MIYGLDAVLSSALSAQAIGDGQEAMGFLVPSASRPWPKRFLENALALVTDISQIVAPLALQADEQVEWPPTRMRVRTYLTTTLPPLDLVSSVRALVRQGDQILVVHDPVSLHILPGGRVVCQGQTDGKDAATPFFAHHIHRAAVERDQLLDDVQPNA